jgi:dynein heavy chain 1
MDVLSPGAANGTPTAPSPTPSASGTYNNAFDTNLVIDHLVSLLSITLGASAEDLEGPGSLLSKAKKSETVQRCQRFASEAQQVIYLKKDLASSDQTNGTHRPTGNLAYVPTGI